LPIVYFNTIHPPLFGFPRDNLKTGGFRGFPQSWSQIPQKYLKSGHDYFLPHHSKFNIQNPVIPRYITHEIDKISLNKPRATVANIVSEVFDPETLHILQDDSKLLSGFPWPIIFKPEITK
jgi:hypothetical protein